MLLRYGGAEEMRREDCIKVVWVGGGVGGGGTYGRWGGDWMESFWMME